MQFITVRDFRSNTAKMWRKLRQERQLVVTRRGRPVAVMVDTDERRISDTLEEIQRRAAIEAVESIRREARKNGTSRMSMEEIDAIIAETRRARRK